MGFFDRFRPKVAEPEIRYVPGECVWVEAYMTECWHPEDMSNPFGRYGGPRKRYYRTCAEAHTESHGTPVTKVRLLRVGDGLYSPPENFYLRRVALQPKPKKAKGAK